MTPQVNSSSSSLCTMSQITYAGMLNSHLSDDPVPALLGRRPLRSS